MSGFEYGVPEVHLPERQANVSDYLNTKILDELGIKGIDLGCFGFDKPAFEMTEKQQREVERLSNRRIIEAAVKAAIGDSF